MREVIEPLALVPGVRIAAMVSPDGIPISALTSDEHARSNDDQQDEGDRGCASETLAVAAAGWLGDVTRAVGQLSWSAPHRLVMQTNQGTVVIQQGPGAIVLCVLERGAAAEEIRVPMEGAIARMQRLLRGMGPQNTSRPAAQDSGQPPGIFPGQPADSNVRGSNTFVPNAPNENRGND